MVGSTVLLKGELRGKAKRVFPKVWSPRLPPLWELPASGLTEVVKYLGASAASIGCRFPNEGMGLPTREKLRRKMMGVTESSTQA